LQEVLERKNMRPICEELMGVPFLAIECVIENYTGSDECEKMLKEKMESLSEIGIVTLAKNNALFSIEVPLLTKFTSVKNTNDDKNDNNRETSDDVKATASKKGHLHEEVERV
jgi:hypothetical protein